MASIPAQRPEPAGGAQLVAALQAGDSAAWEALYRSEHRRLVVLLYHRVGHTATAEDLAQQVWVRALNGIGGFTYRGTSVAAWLTTIAVNLATDHFKAKHNQVRAYLDDAPEQVDADPRPDEEAVRSELAATLQAALGRLTQQQRAVIEARYLRDLSIEETAREIGSNASAVKAMAFRAVRALQRAPELEAMR